MIPRGYRVMRGHATHIDGKILYITTLKLATKFCLTICQPDLFEIQQRRARGCHGTFRRFITLPSVSNKIDHTSRLLFNIVSSHSLYCPMTETEAIR